MNVKDQGGHTNVGITAGHAHVLPLCSLFKESSGKISTLIPDALAIVTLYRSWKSFLWPMQSYSKYTRARAKC